MHSSEQLLNLTNCIPQQTSRTGCLTVNVCDIDTLTGLSMPDASPPLTTLPGTAPNGCRTTVNEIEITAESTNIQTVSLISTTLLTSKPATPNGDNQHLNTGTDNVPHTIKHPSVTCSTPVSKVTFVIYEFCFKILWISLR